jgi:3',5'-nucleoside bisphosphate phosphatase
VKTIRKAPQPDLVDLHVHSSVSDGTLSPREVVRHAAEVGLKAMALTDHDTVAGVPEAMAVGAECGVEVIAGSEISAEFKDGACHILAYFIDPDEPALRRLLAEARDGRAVRNALILARLNELGFPLTMDDVANRSPDGVLTRAHFAGAMVERGYAKTWDGAFDKYLGAGKPAYVHRPRVLPAEAIAVIHGAGGLAALAHPRQLNRATVETAAYIEQLAAAGLDAVETSTPDHTANLARRYHEAAAACGLLDVGGTDWHGSPHGGIHMGLGRGSMAIHYEVVERLKERLAARGNAK